MLKLTLEEGMGVVIGGKLLFILKTVVYRVYCDTIEQEERRTLHKV